LVDVDDVDLVDSAAVARLAAVGISSVEELLSAIVIDRSSVADILGLDTAALDDLERKCVQLADPELVSAIGLPAIEWPCGALPPAVHPSQRGPYPRRVRVIGPGP
jgi:hypothetical protein